MASKNLPATKTSVTKKTFSYSKGEFGTPGEVNLNFTLTTDTQTQLKGFLECLKLATADVEAEIAKLKGK